MHEIAEAVLFMIQRCEQIKRRVAARVFRDGLAGSFQRSSSSMIFALICGAASGLPLSPVSGMARAVLATSER